MKVNEGSSISSKPLKKPKTSHLWHRLEIIKLCILEKNCCFSPRCFRKSVAQEHAHMSLLQCDRFSNDIGRKWTADNCSSGTETLNPWGRYGFLCEARFFRFVPIRSPARGQQLVATDSFTPGGNRSSPPSGSSTRHVFLLPN